MSSNTNTAVLTTGQVARICKVAPRTVSKWFDRGQLQGYKIPGSRDRRIPVRQLVSFMKEHGMPTDDIETGPALTLIIAAAGSRGDELVSTLNGHTEVMRAQSLFEAGCMIERSRPQTVVIDAAEFGPQLAGCIEAIKANSNGARIVTVGGNAAVGSIYSRGLSDTHVDDIRNTAALLSAVTQSESELRVGAVETAAAATTLAGQT